MNPVYIYHALRTPMEAKHSGGSYREIRPLDLLGQTLLAMSDHPYWKGSPPRDFILGCDTPLGDLGKNIARAALVHAGMHAISGVQINRFDLGGLDALGWSMARIGSGAQESLVAGGISLQGSVEGINDRGSWTDDPDLAVLSTGFPPVFSADLQAYLRSLTASDVQAYAETSRLRLSERPGEGCTYLHIVTDVNGIPLVERDRLPEMGAFVDNYPLLTEAVYHRFLSLAQKKYVDLEHFARIHDLSTTAQAADGLALLLVGGKPTTSAQQPIARILAYELLESSENLPFAGMEQAAQAVLAKAGLRKNEIDLWICDEPFAGIALGFQQGMQVDPDKLNISGGNLAFGRPAAANGPYLLVRLLEDLKNKQLTYGLLVLADHSGSCAAMIVENHP